MKQYLITEADREYLMGHLSGKPWNALRDLKPITRLTDERIAELWDSERESTGSIRQLRFDFARAIERELLGGEQ